MSNRRTFLHNLGLGAGLSALTPTLLSATPAGNSSARPAPKLRVAIMGLGSYGTRVAAVPYTHLDVYKRQSDWRPKEHR